MSLKGKSAIVTGSTSGIGLGIAEALARAGANVMINGFGSEDEINAAMSAVTAAGAPKVVYSKADMSKGDEIAAMVGEAERLLARLTFWSTMPAFSSSRRLKTSPLKNGTRLSPSISQRLSIASRQRCRA